MTAQSPEQLKNKHPDFEMGDWRVYSIIRGTPTLENHGWGDRDEQGRLVPVYRADPGDPSTQYTSNWKGYTRVLRLGPDGRLTLLRFKYDDPKLKPRVVNEVLEGDFYIVLKTEFFGPRLYVPFRDGVLVMDRDAWLHEREAENSPLMAGICPGCHPDFPPPPRS